MEWIRLIENLFAVEITLEISTVIVGLLWNLELELLWVELDEWPNIELFTREVYADSYRCRSSHRVVTMSEFNAHDYQVFARCDDFHVNWL